MRLLSALALLACLAASVCAGALADANAGNDRQRKLPELRDVRKIYVGEMGSADEADRFRLLLEEALSKKGFAVVSSPVEADAILSGALSVRVMDDSTQARVFVKLESSGRRLWARDFGHKMLVNPLSRKEPTKRRAEEVASGLRRDWERAK